MSLLSDREDIREEIAQHQKEIEGYERDIRDFEILKDAAEDEKRLVERRLEKVEDDIVRRSAFEPDKVRNLLAAGVKSCSS
jgi:hypothetical protein